MHWFIEVFTDSSFFEINGSWTPVNERGYVGNHFEKYYPLEEAVRVVEQLSRTNFYRHSFRLHNDNGEIIPGEIFV